MMSWWLLLGAVVVILASSVRTLVEEGGFEFTVLTGQLLPHLVQLLRLHLFALVDGINLEGGTVGASRERRCSRNLKVSFQVRLVIGHFVESLLSVRRG